jgi:hypothetical protein
MIETLQLTTQGNAAAEKNLDAHKKNIRIYVDGVHRSGAQLFGYAFLAGREMNLAAEALPHGQMGKWLKANFPDITHPTEVRWRSFAKDLEAKFATVANLKPLQLKKSFTKKDQATILAAVPDLLDGQGMVEFMQSAKLLREPKLTGGDRTLFDKDQIKLWCSEYHPGMPARECQALGGPLKKEFRKWAANQALTMAPDEFDQAAQNDIAAIDVMAGQPARHNGCLAATLNEWIERAEHLLRALKEARSKRKSTTP